MCGLAGGMWRDGRRIPESLGLSTLATIAHRGPDAESFHIAPGVFLGHRRLSIIDLDTRGTQPMMRGDLAIVYNGEIYNYRSIRTALEKRGARFKTESDTEVILAAYELDGIDCLASFEGMFAFAIWNQKAGKLTLARDRFGEKPMVYLFDKERFLFGSEIPPVQCLAEGKLETDKEALSLFFQFSYIPGALTPFQSMHQLESGHVVTLDVGAWSIEKKPYFRLATLEKPVRPNNMTFDEAKTELKRLLTKSVNDRLAASDVPVATFLSGGLDSSIITSIAGGIGGRTVSAYSIAFPNDPEFDESPFARQVAKLHPSIDHKVIEATEDNLAAFTEKTLSMLGEPFGDASIIPTAFLCAHVEEKAILGGDGADEILGGYGVYSAMRLSQKIPGWIKAMLLALPKHANPASIANPRLRAAALALQHMNRTPIAEYLSWRSYASAKNLGELGFPPFQESGPLEEFSSVDLQDLRSLLITDIEFNLPGDMLKKADLASMQHGLEVRLPYLDSELVCFALNLPESYVIDKGVRKVVLREAFKDILPLEIVTRRKQGFLLPVRKWMKGGRIREELLDLAGSQTSINVGALQRIAQEHRDGRCDHSALMWCCYTYLKWSARSMRTAA